MSCGCTSSTPPIAGVGAQQSLRLSSDVAAGSFSAGRGHNQAEIIVGLPASVLTGDVHILRVEGNTEGFPVRALVATIAYDVRGGRWQGRIPPGARLLCELENYTGSGDVQAILTTWCGP